MGGGKTDPRDLATEVEYIHSARCAWLDRVAWLLILLGMWTIAYFTGG